MSNPVTYDDIQIYPRIVPVSDDYYQLENGYSYVWKTDRYYRINVPANFVYDGASRPRIGALVDIKIDGQFRTAALIHDAIYVLKGIFPEGGFQVYLNGSWVSAGKTFTRKDADKLFARILEESGVKSWKVKLSYFAVRAGGWLYWNRDNKNENIALRNLYISS